MLKPTESNQRGFTLVELLVVVAILAVLIAILLPALHKAKYQTRVVLCQALLHNMGVGLATYAGEYNSYFPAHQPAYSGSGGWKESGWARSWSLKNKDEYDMRELYAEYLGGPIDRTMKCPLASDFFANADLDTDLHNNQRPLPYMLFVTNNYRTKTFGFDNVGAYEKQYARWSPVTEPALEFGLLASDFIYGQYDKVLNQPLSTHPGPNGHYGEVGDATNNNKGYDIGLNMDVPINYLDENGSVQTYKVNGTSWLDRNQWVANDQGKNGPKGAFKFLLPRAMAR